MDKAIAILKSEIEKIKTEIKNTDGLITDDEWNILFVKKFECERILKLLESSQNT